MKKLIQFTFFYGTFVTLGLSASCSNIDRKGSLDIRDSLAIISTALNHILKTADLPKDYFNQPLKLVVPKGLSTNVNIIVNGKKCILLPNGTLPSEIMKHMDIFKPIPLVEIPLLKNENGIISIEFILRSTGHNFLIEMKNNKEGKFTIIKFRERTI